MQIRKKCEYYNVLLVAKLHQTVKMPAQIEQGIKNEMIFIAQALLKFIYHVLTFSHIHRIILQKKKAISSYTLLSLLRHAKMNFPSKKIATLAKVCTFFVQ